MSKTEEGPTGQKPSNFAQNLNKLRNYIYFDLGPKTIPIRYVVNAFKGLTFIWVIFLMYYFQNFSKGMYLYLFLHGTYGIFWLIKDLIFPDASFKQVGSLGVNAVTFLILTSYWMIPVTIASGHGIQQPTERRTIFCIAIYLIGLFLMLGSDYQKTSTLSKTKGLISNGFFSRTRNPNYLGEILIYGSFAACTGHPLSYLIVVGVWCSLFAVNMYLKDECSYKLKNGWKQYKQKTFILLPKIFKSNMMNYIIYAALLMIFYNYYSQCCDGHGHEHGHDHHQGYFHGNQTHHHHGDHVHHH